MNEANVSKFMIKKWNIVNDQSDANYDAKDKEIKFSTIQRY